MGIWDLFKRQAQAWPPRAAPELPVQDVSAAARAGDAAAVLRAAGGAGADALQRALSEAISAQQTAVVRALLGQGPDAGTQGDRSRWVDPNAVETAFYRNPDTGELEDACEEHRMLSIAALHGTPETVQLLLDAGADVRAGDDDALCMAALRGDVAVAEVLLAAGARADAPVSAPICMAARGGRAMVELLLAHGADVNQARTKVYHPGPGRDFKDYQTALANAVDQNDEGLVAFLLAKGADVRADDFRAVGEAFGHHYNPKIIRMLMEAPGFDINAECEPYFARMRPLVSAVWSGRAPHVALLLARGAEVTAEALAGAAQRGHAECLALLLAHGGDARAVYRDRLSGKATDKTLLQHVPEAVQARFFTARLAYDKIETQPGLPYDATMFDGLLASGETVAWYRARAGPDALDIEAIAVSLPPGTPRLKNIPDVIRLLVAHGADPRDLA